MIRNSLMIPVVLVVLACGDMALAENAQPKPFFGVRFVQREEKVEVSYVDPLGLGRRIGLKKGDVVTHFQSKAVSTADDLVAAMKEGAYRFEVERPRGDAVVKKVFEGQVKKLDEAEVRKIKEKYPDTPVSAGTFYVVPAEKSDKADK